MSEITTQATPAPAMKVRPKYRRQLRRRSLAPTQRDLNIFKKVELEKLTHEEAAERFGIHRTRVTQIVNRVRIYLAGANPHDKQIENDFASHRLEQELEKLRYEHALAAALKALRREQTNLVTHRVGARNKNNQQEGWSETITRDIPPNIQAIKAVVRVTQELGKLNQRRIEANPLANKQTPFEKILAVANLLDDFYRSSPDDDDAPSEAFLDIIKQFGSNLRTWIHHMRYGVPSKFAWPGPSTKRNSEESESAADDDSANAPAPKTNNELTSSGYVSPNATHDAVRS